MASEPLLTRDTFRTAVFARDGGPCVVCGQPAQDAHHIIERRLFGESLGYYLSNGASLCAACHLRAERTEITCEQLWAAIGVSAETAARPPDFDPDVRYDKWGNQYLPGGMRLPGRLYYDESVQRILAGQRHLFITDRFKYRRTYHLPWSPGLGKGDRMLASLEQFEGRRVVVTEKMDGENTSLYADGLHARSLDTKRHPSRNWVSRQQARLAADIPPGWRICGENLFARHSIHYRRLPTFFMVFSIWNEENLCLSWDETLEWCELLGLQTVPVLYDGPWDEPLIRGLYTPLDGLGNEMEGYVVRLADAFHYYDFERSVGKYVRANHVQTDEHWLNQPVTPNEL